MTCGECKFYAGQLDGCMYSTDPSEEACDLFMPVKKEDDNGDKQRN